MGIFNFFSKKENKEKLDQGLEKTKQGFFTKLTKTLVGKSRIDDEVLDNLEEVLISSDVGVDTTLKIIERVRERVAKEKYTDPKELDFLLKDEISLILRENRKEESPEFTAPKLEVSGKKVPYVIMVVGVNGVGKTTTIGKLAYRFKESGFKVLLGAGDTFRAAAVNQLKIWGDRVGIPVVDKGMDADPAAVAFDAVVEGIKGEYDIVIVDTAGRLQTKTNLMAELTRIKKSMGKNLADAPHEIILVLDASTGQNAISQATAFTEATEVNALALTKLDGTAKGGVVIGISNLFKIPVKYIGVGEGIEDLQVFDPREFVDSMFKK